MTDSGIAARYAHALLDAAVGAEDDLDALVSDFADFVAALDENPDFRRALASGGVPLAKRSALAQAAARRCTENPRLVRTVVLMVARERGVLVPHACDALRRAVDVRKGITDVQLTSAEALRPEEGDRARDALQEALGIVPRLHLEVDPTILGGFVARVGNRIYDASLERELARFEERAGQPHARRAQESGES